MLSLSKHSAKPVLTSLAMALSALTSGLCHGETLGNERLFPLSKIGDQTLQERPSLNRQLVLKTTHATKDQIDPLRKSASIIFSADIITIRQATRTVIKSAGYELLESGGNTSELLTELLDAPLPDNLRSFYHLHIYEMLRAIAGVGFVPVFDHLHRKVTFDPKPLYIDLGSAPARDTPESNKLLMPVIPEDTMSFSNTGMSESVEGQAQDIPENIILRSDTELALKGTSRLDIDTIQNESIPEDANPVAIVLPEKSLPDLNTEILTNDHAAHVDARTNLNVIDQKSAMPLEPTYPDDSLLDLNTGLPIEDGQWQVVGADNFPYDKHKSCSTSSAITSDSTGCSYR